MKNTIIYVNIVLCIDTKRGGSIVIIEDTRNKPSKNAHIKEQLEKLGHNIIRSKLFVGDYALANNHSVCIDTKANLSELCGNVIQDHERFRNECIRAKEAGIKLMILVIEPKIACLSDVYGWYNPRLRYSKKATTGRQLGKILYSMSHKYDVIFEFCTKDKVGSTIIQLLGGDKT